VSEHEQSLEQLVEVKKKLITISQPFYVKNNYVRPYKIYMKQLNKLPSQVALQERKKFQDFANNNQNFKYVQKFYHDNHAVEASIDEILKNFKAHAKFAVKDSMNAEEQEQQVVLDFKVACHPDSSSPEGLHYSFTYPKFVIQARLESPWKLSSLAIVHPDESDLTPESISSIKLF